jgi:hypothetical protein
MAKRRQGLSFLARSLGLVFLLMAAKVLGPAGPVLADTYTETYYFSTGGISVTDIDGNSFIDRSPGPDLLPYTADDEELPAGGNPGGTWSFAALDNDGDGIPEHLFSCARRGDDDEQTFTSYSDFAHGVFAEGEDWIDFHEANHQGPSKDGTLGIDPGDDFEFNDRPNWEDQSNWFWYNNYTANQRGLGGSKYYFELKNDGGFDEVQEWVKTVNFQTNADDPDTPESEKSNSYVRGSNVVIKGLLIPLDAIPKLKDGELDPLFGWQTIDMAKYVREVLGPKLADPQLTIYENDEGGNICGHTHSLLPATFLMIQEGEFQVELMTGQPDYLAHAEYWGIQPDSPGSAKTGSVFRWSKILLKGDDDVYDDDGQWNPSIHLLPDSGRPESLWRKEQFVREDVNEFNRDSLTGTGLPDTWGALRLGCKPTPGADSTPPEHCWFFWRDNDDLGLPRYEDCQKDYALTLPPGSGPKDSWFELPLTRTLDAKKAVIRAEVEVRVEAQNADHNRIQIILAEVTPTAATPVAWADIKDGELTRSGSGGTLVNGGGPVVNGTAIVPQALGIISAVEGTYTRFELLFDAAHQKMSLRSDGTEILGGPYSPTFTDSQVNALRIWTESGAGDQNRIYVNTLAVYQEVPQPFVRGEANCDGTTDISDAVSILNYLFTGGTPPCCQAAANVNGDGTFDISDPVTLLNYLFLGGALPAAPFPICGVDLSSDLSCDSFPACP